MIDNYTVLVTGSAMEETTYLLRSPANALYLLESIAELEKMKIIFSNKKFN